MPSGMLITITRYIWRHGVWHSRAAAVPVKTTKPSNGSWHLTIIYPVMQHDEHSTYMLKLPISLCLDIAPFCGSAAFCFLPTMLLWLLAWVLQLGGGRTGGALFGCLDWNHGSNTGCLALVLPSPPSPAWAFNPLTCFFFTLATLIPNTVPFPSRTASAISYVIGWAGRFTIASSHFLLLHKAGRCLSCTSPPAPWRDRKQHLLGGVLLLLGTSTPLHSTI